MNNKNNIYNFPSELILNKRHSHTSIRRSIVCNIINNVVNYVVCKYKTIVKRNDRVSPEI